jgi:hypothetical protein
MTKIIRQKGVIVFLLLGGAASCSSVSSSKSSDESNAGGMANPSIQVPSYSGKGGSMAGGLPGGSDPVVVPPEVEQTLDFMTPQAGGKYVYVANPTRDTVAIIDSLTLAITEVTPGDGPTYLATVPGKDIALVINAGSGTLSILRDKSVAHASLPVVKSANTIAIAPDGVHAVVWFDANRASGRTLTGSIQDVSLVNLTAGAESSYTLTVGFQPSSVVFSDDNKAAFVITKDGISKLVFAAITGDAIAPLVRIALANPVASTGDAGVVDVGVGTDGGMIDGGMVVDVGMIEDARMIEDGGFIVDGGMVVDGGPGVDASSVTTSIGSVPVDVSVTRNGRYAVARREGSGEIILVDLESRVVRTRTLPGAITDLDLWHSGTKETDPVYAFAVLRNQGSLVRLTIPDSFSPGGRTETWSYPQETIGSVSIGKAGKYALLYTTALSVPRILVLPLQSTVIEPLVVTVQKSIRAVALAPDEKTALILHTKALGNVSAPGLTLEEQLDRSYGYSVVNLSEGIAKLQLTSAMPDPFVITPDSTQAFVLLRDDASQVRMAERISLASFKAVDFPLGSPPNGIGTLAAAIGKVFVSQIHSEGRISFINWNNDKVETVTGFALNGRIRQ